MHKLARAVGRALFDGESAGRTPFLLSVGITYGYTYMDLHAESRGASLCMLLIAFWYCCKMIHDFRIRAANASSSDSLSPPGPHERA